MAVSLDDLTEKIDAGEPLTDEDVAVLGSTRDIIRLGMLASTVRRRQHGNEVTYVRVADLKLDDMADLTASAKAPASLDEALRSRKVGTTNDTASDNQTDVVPTFRSNDSAGEIRIFQTPHTLDAAIAVVEKARGIAGTTPLSAFCLFELGKLPEGLPVVLSSVKKAGLDTIAQAPIDRLTMPESALEAMADAGLGLARLTVNDPSTGSGSPQEREWTAVCRDVAALQTRLRAILVFAPLARKIDATQPTTGYEDVKRIAISRLLAHNIDTIQVDWALYGPKLAQVALTFGADDIDSVAATDEAAQGHRRSPLEEIRRSIRAAGFEPVERDGGFNKRG